MEPFYVRGMEGNALGKEGTGAQAGGLKSVQRPSSSKEQSAWGTAGSL
jgi:hypothetical protein